jgi:hypothetical protein
MIFLDKCTELRVLSLNGSLSSSDGSIERLKKFLSHNTTVQELSICGTELNSLTAAEVVTVLEVFKKQNRTVTVLELSHNAFDDKAIHELADVLIHNRVIMRVALQNIGFTDPVSLEGFLKRVAQRGTPLEIPAPRPDLEEMLRSRELDIDGLTEIIELLSLLEQGDPSIAIPPEATRLPSFQPSRPSTASQGGSRLQPPGPEEWEFTFDPVPEPDGEALLRGFRLEFTVERLVLKIKATG